VEAGHDQIYQRSDVLIGDGAQFKPSAANA